MADTNSPEASTQSDGSGDNQQPQQMSTKVKAFVWAAVLVGLSGSITAITQGAVTWVADGITHPFKADDAKPKPSIPKIGPTTSLAKTPFTVTVDQPNPWDSCVNGSGLVYLKPPTLAAIDDEWKRRLAPPYDVMGLKSNFDKKHLGQPANFVILNVQIHGRSDEAITINDVSIVPVKVTLAPKALRLKFAGSCGGTSQSRFSVNLDSRGQRKVFKTGTNDAGVELVRRFPYQVTKGEPETMQILPYTNESDYSFRLAISWASSAGKSVTVVGDLDHGNEPFRVVSGAQSEKYIVDQGESAHPYKEQKVDDPFDDLPAQ
ncbi:hypothetical protein ACIRJM_38295 [Streptomyces sp. NPDC102405]|jgi:hypothetical protein|uniref:hypothetical protein n=1 Tax=Streptomyces sp. NPDC102405 TaxID=3366170 RepID=UPI0037F56E22